MTSSRENRCSSAALLLCLAVCTVGGLEATWGYDPDVVAAHYAAHPEFDPSTPEFAAREAKLAAEKASEVVGFDAGDDGRPMPCGREKTNEQCRRDAFTFDLDEMDDEKRAAMVEGAEALRCAFQTYGFTADVVKKTLGNIRRAVPELSAYKSIPDPLFVRIPNVKPLLIEHLLPANCMLPATPLVCAYIALLVIGNPAPKKDWDTLFKSTEAVDFMVRSGLLEGYKTGPEPEELELQVIAQLWPVDRDLVIASDLSYVPETPTASRASYDLVGYTAPSSEGLVANAPISPVETVLDLGTGSGIQAIAALRYYAERAVMVDINPRAVRFAKFNLLLNGMEDRAVVREGNLYDALTEDEVEEGFDVVLATPPSVATPVLTHSGLGTFSFIRNTNDGIVGRRPTPLWEDGGSSGEVVLSRAIGGAGDVLKIGGRLVVAADLWDAFAYDQKLAAWLEPWTRAKLRDANGDFIHHATSSSDAASVEVDTSGDVKVSDGRVDSAAEEDGASVAYTYYAAPVTAKKFARTMGGPEGMCVLVYCTAPSLNDVARRPLTVHFRIFLLTFFRYPGTVQESTGEELDGTVAAWLENVEANGMSFVAPGFVYVFKGGAGGNGGAADIKPPMRVATANTGGPKGRGAQYPYASGHAKDWTSFLPETVHVARRAMRRSPSLGEDACAKKVPETYIVHVARGNETNEELLDVVESLPLVEFERNVRGEKTGIQRAVEQWWTKKAWKEGAKRDKKWRKKQRKLLAKYAYAPMPLPKEDESVEAEVVDVEDIEEDFGDLEEGETVILLEHEDL